MNSEIARPGRRRPRRLRFLVTVVVLGAAAAAGFAAFTATRNASSVGRTLFGIRTRPGVTLPQGRPAASASVQATRGDLVKTIRASGRLVPKQDVTLSFDVAGKISAVHVEEGQRVSKGQVLAEIDRAQLELNLLKARNAYETAQLESPPGVVEERRADLRLAEAQLEAAALRAPFDGLVAEVNVRPGEQAGTNTAVLRLIDDSSFGIEVLLDEVDLPHVQPGQEATLSLVAYPEARVRGVVRRVGVVPSSQSSDLVLFPVQIEVLGSDPRLRAGLSVDVSIVVERAQNVIKLPLEAVAEVNGRAVVNRITPEGTQPVAVELGLSNGVEVEIVRGLQEGDRVAATSYDLYRQVMEQRAAGASTGAQGFAGQRGAGAPFPGGAGAVRSAPAAGVPRQ